MRWRSLLGIPSVVAVDHTLEERSDPDEADVGQGGEGGRLPDCAPAEGARQVRSGEEREERERLEPVTNLEPRPDVDGQEEQGRCEPSDGQGGEATPEGLADERYASESGGRGKQEDDMPPPKNADSPRALAL